METDCFANWPRSLFKMRLTDDSSGITSPNELILDSYSGIKNTFYAMNSLVAFNSVGGIVTLKGASSFSHMHLCGSMIKDSFTDLGSPDLRGYVNEDYLSEAQLSTIETI